MDEVFIPPDVATLYHANRDMDHNPCASYQDVIAWLSQELPARFPWVIVTPDVERAIVERLNVGKAADA